MRVRAIAQGFFDINKNGHPIDIAIGQEFDYPDDRKPGKWFEKVEALKDKPKGEQKPLAKSDDSKPKTDAQQSPI